jgi:hypothetical protein
MYFIAYGKLKNAFREWTELISKFKAQLDGKRQKVLEKLARSCMSHEQQAFLLWKELMQQKRAEDALLRKMIEKMLRSAGLMVYNLFSRWKLQTFTDKEKKR